MAKRGEGRFDRELVASVGCGIVKWERVLGV
jgi:hypothetical protein